MRDAVAKKQLFAFLSLKISEAEIFFQIKVNFQGSYSLPRKALEIYLKCYCWFFF